MGARTDHILVVDDDPDVRKLLKKALTKGGYRISSVGRGRDMTKVLEHKKVDLVILDLGLPDGDGLELCRNLRANTLTPVIILTARNEEVERIIGLEMGADDYVVKPFSPREIAARVKTVLRRTRQMPQSEEVSPGEFFHFSGWSLDRSARKLLSPTGREVLLTHGEMRLLTTFLTHPNRVLNREQLLNLTKRSESEPFDRSIDIMVSRLRGRLQENTKKPQIIQTVRGEGYMLSASVEKHLSPLSENPPPATLPPAPPWLGHRILVLEPNPAARKLLCTMVMDLGCQATAVSDGETLEKLDLSLFSLALVSSHFPGAENLANQSSTPLLIGLVGDGRRGRSRSLAAGFDDALERPILPQHLQGILTRWVGELHKDSPSKNDPVDYPVVKQLRRTGGDGFVQAVALLLKNLEESSGWMAEGIKRNKIRPARESARQLLDPLLTLGATELAGMCQDLVDSRPGPDPKKWFRNFTTARKRLEKILRAEVEGVAPSANANASDNPAPDTDNEPPSTPKGTLTPVEESTP
ncbi:MAG: response regulator [Magnetococcales bacterium]|nr:response regulator [Magnetococcales bacterium]